LVSNENPLVKKLTILRNNSVAHIGIKKILTDKDEPAPLTWSEFEQLLVKGLEIFNKYRSLFDSSTHFSQLIGEDDYKFVLKYIKIGLDGIEFKNKVDEEFYNP
jgi:hypothetical protein